MRKLALILVVLGLLGLAQAGQAATLDSTWYVKVTSVSVWKYAWDPVNHYYYEQGMGNGYFSRPVGQYGPFQVTSTEPALEDDIFVTVPAATQAGGTDSLRLPFTISGYVTDAYMQFNCLTNYDSSQVYASLWQANTDGTSTFLWSQLQSGAHGTSPTIFIPVTGSNYYFQVSVVPEPSSLLCIVAPFAATLGLAIRRSRSSAWLWRFRCFGIS